MQWLVGDAALVIHSKRELYDRTDGIILLMSSYLRFLTHGLIFIWNF